MYRFLFSSKYNFAFIVIISKLQEFCILKTKKLLFSCNKATNKKIVGLFDSNVYLNEKAFKKPFRC